MNTAYDPKDDDALVEEPTIMPIVDKPSSKYNVEQMEPLEKKRKTLISKEITPHTPNLELDCNRFQVLKIC